MACETRCVGLGRSSRSASCVAALNAQLSDLAVVRTHTSSMRLYPKPTALVHAPPGKVFWRGPARRPKAKGRGRSGAALFAFHFRFPRGATQAPGFTLRSPDRRLPPTRRCTVHTTLSLASAHTLSPFVATIPARS